MSAKKREVTGTLEGGRVLDGPAHLLSRVLVSQSASVACCPLPLCATHTMVRIGHYSSAWTGPQYTAAEEVAAQAR
jgi:hypothetical protein